MTKELGFDEGNDDVVTSFEQHSYQMERDRQKQSAELEKVQRQGEYDVKRAVQNRKHDRNIIVGWVLGVMAASVAAVGVSYIIWQGVAGPSESERLEDKWRTECIQHNGTWIPVDLDSRDSSTDVKGMCVSQNSKVEGFGD